MTYVVIGHKKAIDAYIFIFVLLSDQWLTLYKPIVNIFSRGRTISLFVCGGTIVIIDYCYCPELQNKLFLCFHFVC